MISRDTVAIDPRVRKASAKSWRSALAAGCSATAKTLGFRTQPPMSALPSFAGGSCAGSFVRHTSSFEIIQRALARFPAGASRESNGDPAVSRPKKPASFLRFARSRWSREFQKAMQHMLYARQFRGFDINRSDICAEEDLIKASGRLFPNGSSDLVSLKDFSCNVFPVDSSQDSLAQGRTVKDIVLTDKGPGYRTLLKREIQRFLFVSARSRLIQVDEFRSRDIRQQTERALGNLKGILRASGANLHHVVKTVYG